MNNNGRQQEEEEEEEEANKKQDKNKGGFWIMPKYSVPWKFMYTEYGVRSSTRGTLYEAVPGTEYLSMLILPLGRQGTKYLIGSFRAFYASLHCIMNISNPCGAKAKFAPYVNSQLIKRYARALVI